MTKAEMKKLLDESKSMREVILKLGLQPNGSSGYTNVKNKIVKLGLEIPKYNFYGTGHSKRKYSNDEVFCIGSTLPRQKVKNRIMKEKLIKYKCSGCGNDGEHNGKVLSLHLDHINGVNDDNRLENLRFLCPNCHSQTETYAGKANKTL